jgi:hypothetical protein
MNPFDPSISGISNWIYLFSFGNISTHLNIGVFVFSYDRRDSRSVNTLSFCLELSDLLLGVLCDCYDDRLSYIHFAYS